MNAFDVIETAKPYRRVLFKVKDKLLNPEDRDDEVLIVRFLAALKMPEHMDREKARNLAEVIGLMTFSAQQRVVKNAVIRNILENFGQKEALVRFEGVFTAPAPRGGGQRHKHRPRAASKDYRI